MLQRVLLAPHYFSAFVPSVGLFLISERESAVFEGEVFGALLPFLRRGENVDSILDALGHQFSEATILYALNSMQEGQYLIEPYDHGVTPAAEAAHWAARNLHPVNAIRAIKEKGVEIAADGDIDSASLQEAFAIAGLNSGSPCLTLLATDNYKSEAVSDFNKRALASGRPWMLIKPVGDVIWIGPILVPGKTACAECLTSRLRQNNLVASYVERYSTPAVSVNTSVSRNQTLQSMASHLATLQIVHWLTNATATSLEGTLLTFDSTLMRLDFHSVVRRPQCLSCGSPGTQRTSNRVESLNRPSPIASVDCGSRSTFPGETFEKYKHHISPITGVAKSLTRWESGSEFVHVYVAGHNFAHSGGSLDVLTSGLRHSSSGKGKSDLQAKTSALCEAIERHCGLFQGDETFIVDRFDRLGDAALHPNECMLFSDQQYSERSTWNMRRNTFTRVPHTFDPSCEIRWSPVWSITKDREKLLPTSYLYYHSEASFADAGRPFCYPDSNGNASGNTFTEALLQGFLEVVERDAVALWWYGRLKMPQTDLDRFQSEYLRRCRAYQIAQSREMWVLDITSDFPLPTFAALSRRTSAQEECIVMGFGCNLDPLVAIERAVAEMHQMLPGAHNILRRQEMTQIYDDTGIWLKTATIENQVYLLGTVGERNVGPREYATGTCGSIDGDVAKCLDAATSLGLEVFVLDQTRPDIGLPVVKVIIPGMRHFWPRFAPGRLYDALAKREVPIHLTEAGLNPIPMFL